MKMFRKDEGFTLVELMVVVLIIGILVAIAVPVFLNASANAQTKSCQANQRTIAGAIETAKASTTASATADGLWTDAGSWGTLLTGSYVKAEPFCPAGSRTTANDRYYILAAGVITADDSTAGSVSTPSFRTNHKLP